MNHHRMWDVYRLQKTQQGHKEGSLPTALHRWDTRAIGKAFLLLFPWWLFWLPSNTHPSQRPKQDYVHMPLWNVRLPRNVVWAMQCTCIVPKVHDVHFFRHDRRNYGSLHGWLLSLWKKLRSMCSQSRQSLVEMPRKGPDPQLGEMSFYGPWRHSLGTLGVRERDRGG